MDGQSFSKQAGRESYIDVLKGISILFVILVHFEQKWSAPCGILSKVSIVGARAPQFFFVISAYLTWQSIERHGISSQFFISRAKRLLPTYYVALILSLLLPTVTIRDYSVGNIIAHFFLLHGFNPYWINTIMGVGWYIGDLVIFYLICPLLRKKITSIKSSLIGFAISTGLSILMLVLYNIFLSGVASGLEMYFNTFFFIHQLPVLMLGVVLYYTVEKINNGDLNPWKVLLCSAVMIIVFLGFFIFLHLNKRIFTSSFVSGVLFACVFILAYSVRKVFMNKLFIHLRC